MWNTLIISPLSNTLHFFYTNFQDIGLAIVFVTLIIKLALFPLNISSSKTAKGMKKVQGEIEKLREKHKKDPRELGLALSKLYKENNIKPFAGLLNLLIQIPILIGLYQIIIKEIGIISDKTTFFNIDISTPSIVLAVLSFITMYILMLITLKDSMQNIDDMKDGFQKEFTKMMNMQMKYFLPAIVLITSVFLPAGITIYFVASNVFGIAQALIIRKIIAKH